MELHVRHDQTLMAFSLSSVSVSKTNEKLSMPSLSSDQSDSSPQLHEFPIDEEVPDAHPMMFRNPLLECGFKSTPTSARLISGLDSTEFVALPILYERFSQFVDMFTTGYSIPEGEKVCCFFGIITWSYPIADFHAYRNHMVQAYEKIGKPANDAKWEYLHRQKTMNFCFFASLIDYYDSSNIVLKAAQRKWFKLLNPVVALSVRLPDVASLSVDQYTLQMRTLYRSRFYNHLFQTHFSEFDIPGSTSFFETQMFRNIFGAVEAASLLNNQEALAEHLNGAFEGVPLLSLANKVSAMFNVAIEKVSALFKWCSENWRLWVTPLYIVLKHYAALFKSEAYRVIVSMLSIFISKEDLNEENESVTSEAPALSEMSFGSEFNPDLPGGFTTQGNFAPEIFLKLAQFWGAFGFTLDPSRFKMKGFTGAIKDSETFLAWIFDFLYNIFGSLVPSFVIRAFRGGSDIEIRAWFNDVDEIFRSDAKHELALDVHTVQTVRKRLEEGRTFMTQCSKKGFQTLSPLISSSVRKLEDLDRSLSSRISIASLTRPRPVVLMLSGPSGHGKSNLLLYLAKILAADSVSHTPYDAGRRMNAYECNPRNEIFISGSDKFYDGLTSYQTVGIFDDFDQRRPNAGDETSLGAEFVRSNNEASYAPRMANISDKNNVFLRFNYALYSTNSNHFYDPGMQCVAAAERRIDFNVEVVRKGHSDAPKLTLEEISTLEFNLEAYELYLLEKPADEQTFNPNSQWRRTGQVLTVPDLFQLMTEKYTSNLMYFQSTNKTPSSELSRVRQLLADKEKTIKEDQEYFLWRNSAVKRLWMNGQLDDEENFQDCLMRMQSKLRECDKDGDFMRKQVVELDCMAQCDARGSTPTPSELHERSRSPKLSEIPERVCFASSSTFETQGGKKPELLKLIKVARHTTLRQTYEFFTTGKTVLPLEEFLERFPGFVDMNSVEFYHELLLLPEAAYMCSITPSVELTKWDQLRDTFFTTLDKVYQKMKHSFDIFVDFFREHKYFIIGASVLSVAIGAWFGKDFLATVFQSNPDLINDPMKIQMPATFDEHGVMICPVCHKVRCEHPWRSYQITPLRPGVVNEYVHAKGDINLRVHDRTGKVADDLAYASYVANEYAARNHEEIIGCADIPTTHNEDLKYANHMALDYADRHAKDLQSFGNKNVFQKNTDPKVPFNRSQRLLRDYKGTHPQTVTQMMRNRVSNIGCQLPVTQGATEDISNKVCKSMFTFWSSVAEGELEQNGHGIGVRGRTVLFPLHFLTELLDYAEKVEPGSIASGKIHLALKRGNEEYKFDLDQIERMAYDDSIELDAWLFDVPLPSFPMLPDLTRHFPSNDEASSIIFTAQKNCWANLVNSEEKMMVSHLFGVVHQNVQSAGRMESRRNLISYRCNNGKGLCGSLLVATGNRYAGRILGMHIAGNQSTGVSLGSIVTQQWMKSYWGETIPESDEFQFPDTFTESHRRDYHGDVEADYITRNLEPVCDMHVVNNLLEWNGDGPAYTERKTTQSDPSPLVFAKNRKRFGHLSRGHVRWPKEISSALRTHYLSFHDGTPLRTLSLKEAIMGMPGTHFGGIDHKTSTGYPDGAFGITGKDYWTVDVTGKFLPGPKFAELVEEVNTFCRIALGGGTPAVTFKDCEKGERIKLKKAVDQKVRFINIAPKFVVVLVKMFYGDAIRVLCDGAPLNSILKGYDEKNADYWTVIAKHLDCWGDSVGAGDYAAFDHHYMSESVLFPMRLLDSFYDNPTRLDIEVRRALTEIVVSQYHAFGSVLELYHEGMPSGWPLTSEINCITNLRMFMTGWMVLHDGDPACLPKFFDYVHVFYLGDDNIFAVHPLYAKSFTPAFVAETVAFEGHEYTDVDKGPARTTFSKLSECTVLKRGFRKLRSGKYVGPLDLDVVLEMPLWSREGHDYETIAVQNQDTALRELSLHGEEVFNEWMPKMKAFQGRYWRPFSEDFRTIFSATTGSRP